MTERKRLFKYGLLLMSGLMLASLPACNSTEDAAGDEARQNYKIVVKAALPGVGAPSKSVTRGGTFTDEAKADDGLKFKWEAESEKMFAIACNETNGIVAFSDNNRYAKMTVAPNNDNVRWAELTTATNLQADAAGNNKLYCIQGAGQTPTVADATQVEVSLAMPAGNVFVQTEKNGTSHLTDYLYFSGVGENATASEGTLTFPNISFNTNVATVRLKVNNQSGESKTIRSIVIRSSADEKIFPDTRVWRVDATDTAAPAVSIAEPSSRDSYTASVTAQCGADGYEVTANEMLYNYVAIHQHDAVNALTDKKLDFLIYCTDGTVYYAYNFDCNNLSELTGNQDFVSDYTYTFTLTMTEDKVLNIELATDIAGWTQNEDKTIHDATPQ